MRWSIILPAVYGVIAALVWIDFARLPPDGLANVGLMLAVLPVTLLDLALRGLLGLSRSPFMPSHLGYYPAHAVFFGGASPRSCSASFSSDTGSTGATQARRAQCDRRRTLRRVPQFCRRLPGDLQRRHARSGALALRHADAFVVVG